VRPGGRFQNVFLMGSGRCPGFPRISPGFPLMGSGRCPGFPARWAPHMDPWALAYLAGHRDMSITKRYVHPQEGTLRDAVEKARVANGGHTSGHTDRIEHEKALGDSAATA
jgi:hypothetical protein